MSILTPRSLVASGATLIASQAIQAVIAFGANLVLILYIGPSDFGRFALVVAATSLVLSVISLRTSALILRTPEPEFTQAVRERYFTVLATETVLAATLGIVWIASTGPMSGWAIALVLVLCGRHWIDQNKAYFERQMPYVRLGLLESIIATGAHALSVALVLLGAGPDALYWRELFWLVATATGLYAVGGLTILPLRRLSRDGWFTTFREARAVWLDAALEGAYQRILVQFAGILGGDRGAGFFFQAQRLAMSPHLLFAPIINRIGVNWLRRAEHGDRRRRGRRWMLALVATVLIPIAALVWWFADLAVPAVFGAAWGPAAEPLKLMIGVILFLTLFEVLRVYCVVVRQMKVLLAGRIGQYAATGAALLMVILSGKPPTIETLAIGLSLGYAIPFGIVLILLRRSERRSKPATS